jgi:hypothetical protein
MTRRELNDLPLQAVEIAQMLPKGSSPLVCFWPAMLRNVDFRLFRCLEDGMAP